MTTDDSVRRHGGTAGLTVLAVLALVALGFVVALAAPSSARAAGLFAGGADAVPAFIANDHTPVLVHYSGSGLPAGTSYYLKIRFTVGTGPSSVTNRGWTFDPATGHWIQERDEFVNCPQISSDAAGAIDGYAWANFGDESVTGPYHVLVSISHLGKSDTLNANDVSAVTIVDAATAGFWVHDGSAAGAAAGAAATAVDHTTPATTLDLSRTEANLLDDDSDGVVDNEDYGPAGATGDFRLFVPLAVTADISLGGVSWAPGQGVTSVTPDVDIALGATDVTPPTAPTGLQAKPANGHVDLTWTAASDDTDGPGVLRYRVYRWTDPAPIAGVVQYSPVTLPIATTTVASYSDSSVVNGTAYHYLVRAEDTATNVGPRSGQAGATPDAVPPGPVTGLSASAGDGTVALSWTSPSDADFAAVSVRRAEGAAPATPTDGDAVYAGTGTSADDDGLSDGTTYFYAVFARDLAGNWSTAATTSATPLAATTLTLTADPEIVAYGASSQLTGSLTSGGVGVPGQSVALESSPDGVTWSPAQTLLIVAGPLLAAVAPVDKTSYRLHFAAAGMYAEAFSDPVVVTPRVALTRPSAPKTARHGVKFTVSGYLDPLHAAGEHSVTVRCYRRVGGHWKLSKSVAATNVDAGARTKYTVRLSLPRTGAWRLRAFAPADDTHAATLSAAKSVTVR